MKTFTGLLSLAIVGCCLTASVPAKADTAYHRVYRQPMTATDPFSILDQQQNNALSRDEYKNSKGTDGFDSLDTNEDGFLSRSEFYSSGSAGQNAENLSLITPAAGGTSRERVQHRDIVYRDDPCDACR